MNPRSYCLAVVLALAGATAAWVSWAAPADTTPAQTQAPAAVTATPPASVSAANPQQNRMKSCQADATAKGLKGSDRQTFVNGCLKTKPPPVAANSQQQKMKTCQAQATTQGLQGPDRTTFLSGCLKSNQTAN